MGLRLALGAKPVQNTSLVAGEGARLAILGILLGVAGGALDPASFATGVSLLFAVALLASYLPARRASRVDPMKALRYE